MKQAYTAIAKNEADIHFEALNDTEARHFVINHLDLSKNWSVFRIKTNEEQALTA